MAFRILAVLAAVALSTSAFAASTTTKKTTTTTTTTQSASKPATTTPAPMAKPAPAPTYTVSSSSSKEMNLGLLLGASFYNNSGGTKFTPGLEFTYMVMPEFSLGLELQYPILGDGGVTGLSQSMFTVLVDGWYNISAMPGLHVGAKLGFAFSSASFAGTSVSSTDFAFGPAVGYDHWIAADWTVGLDLDYSIISNAADSKAFQALATAKYWF